MLQFWTSYVSMPLWTSNPPKWLWFWCLLWVTSKKTRFLYNTLLAFGPHAHGNCLSKIDFESRLDCQLGLIIVTTFLWAHYGYWFGPSSFKWSSVNSPATDTPLSDSIFGFTLFRFRQEAAREGRQNTQARAGTNFIRLCASQPYLHCRRRFCLRLSHSEN